MSFPYQRRHASRPDAVELATRKWLQGERLHIRKMAEELGVNRGTLFRWVGSRESFYQEIICKLVAPQHALLIETAEGRGLDLLESVVRRSLAALSTSTRLRSFIESSPAFALGVLTSPTGAVQQRLVELQTTLLRRVIAEANIEPQLDVSTLAHLIVRVGEAFLYESIIGGYELDIEEAVATIRVLVSAQKPEASQGDTTAAQWS